EREIFWPCEGIAPTDDFEYRNALVGGKMNAPCARTEADDGNTIAHAHSENLESGETQLSRNNVHISILVYARKVGPVIAPKADIVVIEEMLERSDFCHASLAMATRIALWVRSGCSAIKRPRASPTLFPGRRRSALFRFFVLLWRRHHRIGELTLSLNVAASRRDVQLSTTATVCHASRWNMASASIWPLSALLVLRSTISTVSAPAISPFRGSANQRRRLA